MINIIDLLWIEQRGMSIISAIGFVCVFVTMRSFYLWTKKEIDDIDAELANQRLGLIDTQKEVSEISVEIGKIQVTLENIEII